MKSVKRFVSGEELINRGDSSLYRSYPSQNLSPAKLSSMLREMDAGYSSNAMNFFSEMEEKDLHLAAVMQTRVMAAASKPRRIEPAGDDKDSLRQADFVREVWQGIEGKSMVLHDLLSAIGYGFSVAELFFEVREKSLIASAIKFCPQNLFAFSDPDKPGSLLEFPRYLKVGNPQGMELPRDKFVYHVHRASTGGPMRSGLYRGLSWYFLFTNFTMKDWMSFMDIYGIPLRLGKFRPTADERSREILKRAVQNLGSDAAAVISDDTTIEFIESKLSGSHELFQGAVEFFNRQKSKRVLGQTLTTEQGSSGSYALGSVHERVRHDITCLDCILLDETITRDFIVPLIKANFGGQKNYPRFVSETKSRAEQASELETLKKLFDMGVPLPKSAFYSAAGMEEPSETDGLISKEPKRKGGLS